MRRGHKRRHDAMGRNACFCCLYPLRPGSNARTDLFLILCRWWAGAKKRLKSGQYRRDYSMAFLCTNERTSWNFFAKEMTKSSLHLFNRQTTRKARVWNTDIYWLNALNFVQVHFSNTQKFTLCHFLHARLHTRHKKRKNTVSPKCRRNSNPSQNTTTPKMAKASSTNKKYCEFVKIMVRLPDCFLHKNTFLL